MLPAPDEESAGQALEATWSLLEACALTLKVGSPEWAEEERILGGSDFCLSPQGARLGRAWLLG